ncbi:MAG: 50S ribosomal protein L28 [Chlamydiae bacterium]|nr:50S ribosomal protein L28 [Chlamydiota bacterium]
MVDSCLDFFWRTIMSKICDVTGKKPKKGRSIIRRGIAKKKKGIGLNITGVSLRRFLPNLFKKRFWFSEEKRFITLKLSTSAMRTIDKKGLAAVVRDMRAQGKKV